MASGYLSYTQQSRLTALKEKREKLKSQIHEARRQTPGSDYYLKQLQKQNLILKDAIFDIEQKAANA